MKKKIGITCLLFATLMLFTFTACGKDASETQEQTSAGTKQEIPASVKSPKTVNANFWDLVYDEEDGWTYEEDDFYDEETASRITLSIPKDGGDENFVSADIYVSVEEPYTFRDYLTSYGFDEYEYAVNESYDLTNIGGVDCLKQEGNYWGYPCLRYLNRVEGASATVLIEVVGEYENECVDKLLSGLTIRLEDKGHKDGPWYWEGEPFSAESRSVMVGTFTMDSQWLPITDCIVTKETFAHDVAVVGNQAFLLVDGALKTEPIVFKEVDVISHLLIDEKHIYVCGSAVDDSGHKVFVYDANGVLQMTLVDSDGGSLGSITFVAETTNGYLALDGNMRTVVLWTKDGTYIGEADGSDLFGTSYPWFCSGTKLSDGSILVIMTETRADKSAEELLAFKLSGF